MAPRASNLRIKFIPILPKRGLDYPLKDHAEFLARAKSYLEAKAKPLIKSELKSFTAGWSTTVHFVGRVTAKPDEISMLVFPQGQPGRNRWIWVSDGTKSKLRRAKRAPSLRFRTGYQPHTRRGGFRGGPGEAFGPYRTPKSVVNNIEARNFETEVKEREEAKIQRDIEIIFKSVYQI